ncbi:TPA: proteasome subunit beta [Candidatus Poribacteria bacterium]|nr:proteasome subunit beta [Candidatus Poribacteria bacterium]
MLIRYHPHLLPVFALPSSGVESQMQGITSGIMGSHRVFERGPSEEGIFIGTTILALKYKDGVVIGGDRRAVDGYQVGERRIEKVFPVDEYSAIAIAGVAGPCIEMARIFQIQVEYHEKMEGTPLSLEGKANFLSSLIRSNMQAAMQGLIVIPIFAGYDLKRKEGRIFKYDLTGGRYEETEYYAIGSGGKDARATMKKLYRPDMERDEALRLAAEALWDAADEDIATGGPDFIRGIYPTIKLITQEGTKSLKEDEVAGLFDELMKKLKEEQRG